MDFNGGVSEEEKMLRARNLSVHESPKKWKMRSAEQEKRVADEDSSRRKFGEGGGCHFWRLMRLVRG